jgi:hypothetical protein
LKTGKTGGKYRAKRWKVVAPSGRYFQTTAEKVFQIGGFLNAAAIGKIRKKTSVLTSPEKRSGIVAILLSTFFYPKITNASAAPLTFAL